MNLRTVALRDFDEGDVEMYRCERSDIIEYDVHEGAPHPDLVHSSRHIPDDESGDLIAQRQQMAYIMGF